MNSTNRADFSGHWQFPVGRVRVINKRTTNGERFDANSTHRADFPEWVGAKPREVMPPHSRDQLKFDWNDPTPASSTLRGDFVPKAPDFCECRAIAVRHKPEGGHTMCTKRRGGRWEVARDGDVANATVVIPPPVQHHHVHH